MARTHKFLILEGSFQENLCMVKHDRATQNRVDYREEPIIRVVECAHEKFEDNCVDLYDEGGLDWNFVKDVNGIFYYWEDVWTKNDLVRAFE